MSIGRTLGPYEIVEYIGAGGMATVYKAYQPDMDRYVALKVLPEQYARKPNFVERFRREAVVIAKLEHAHILPVYGFGEDDGVFYIAMRYVDAGTLADRIRIGPGPLIDVERLLIQVAGALDYAHAHKVIHRDVKPSNVLLDQNDDAFLTDFGIAKILEGMADQTTGYAVGTPHYMSPEQCMGHAIDARTDVYALGVVLYEMVTGRVPFDGDTPYTIIQNKLHAPLTIPRTFRRDLPEAVETVMLKALLLEPAARYVSAGDLAAAFSAALTSSGARHATRTDQPLPPSRATLTVWRALVPWNPNDLTSTDRFTSARSWLKRLREIKPPRWIGLMLLGVLTFLVLILVSILGARFLRTGVTATSSPSVTHTLPATAGGITMIAARTATADARATQVVIAQATRAAQATAGLHTAIALALEATDAAARTQQAWRDLTATARQTVVMAATASPTRTATHTATHTTTRAPTPVATDTPAPPAMKGPRLAFASNRKGDYDIYIMTLGEGENALYPVTTSAEAEIHPAWSPDGARIAFASNRDGDWDIFVTDAEGRTLTKLTDGAATHRAPAWSPDGTRLAFHANRDGDFDIYVMDADGDNLRAITDNTDWDASPAWSPDGQWIAYQSNRGAGYEIFLAPVDDAACAGLPNGCASVERQLTKNEVDDLAPSWSPDGAHIAFASDRDGDFEIFVMDADGARVEQLTTADGDDLHPAWSPDGAQIVFYSDRDGQLDIYALDVDAYPDRNERRLTHNHAGDFWPAWGPMP